MTKELTKEQIWTEIEKLMYPYGLNRVIRYSLERKEPFQTQSVAEHVTNMIFLAYYFRDFEDPKYKLDFNKVVKMIMMHDMGEIETGDIVIVKKTETHEATEREAIKSVRAKSPKFIADEIESLYDEFSDPKTQEGKYAKAIDKFEGQIFWVGKEGVEMLTHVHEILGLETEVAHGSHIKKVFSMLDAYNFPTIKKFLEVIEEKKHSYGIL
ncbi:MAG: HD domain-containing protein [bacterium]